MNRSKNFGVIDIGTSKICAVIACLSPEGKIEILGSGQSSSQGLKGGIVSDIYRTRDSILSALSQAENEAETKIDSVLVGISGDYIEHRNVEGTVTISNYDEAEIKEKNIKDVIDKAKSKATLENKDKENLIIIHAIPRNYAIDSDPTLIENPVGKYGCELKSEVHIIFAKRSNLRDIKKCVELAGYQVTRFVYNGLASASAVLEREQKNYGVICLDIGSGTCDISIYSGGTLYYTKVVPTGGKSITEVLAIGLNTKTDTAEKLKLSELGDEESIDVTELNGQRVKAVTTETINSFIHYRAKELVDEIYSNFLNNNILKNISVGVVLCGGCAKLPILHELLTETFQMFVCAKKPNLEKFCGEKITRLQDVEFASTVGLLLQCVRKSNSAKMNKKFFKDDFFSKIAKFFKDFV